MEHPFQCHQTVQFFSQNPYLLSEEYLLSVLVCVLYICQGQKEEYPGGGGGCMHVYTNPVHTVYQASSTIETPVDICELSNHLHG